MKTIIHFHLLPFLAVFLLLGVPFTEKMIVGSPKTSSTASGWCRGVLGATRILVGGGSLSCGAAVSLAVCLGEDGVWIQPPYVSVHILY